MKEDKTNSKNVSKAKSIGVKSTFKLNEGTYFMTSFGEANKAVPEKLIVGDQTPISLHEVPEYDAKVIEKNKQFQANKNKTSVQIYVKKNSDQLHAKDAIEKKYFETEQGFADNIHIQIAHNIMDIEKIWMYYINYVIFVINNMSRYGFEQNSKDELGTFQADRSIECDRLCYKVYEMGLIDWNKTEKSSSLVLNEEVFLKFMDEVYFEPDSGKSPLASKHKIDSFNVDDVQLSRFISLFNDIWANLSGKDNISLLNMYYKQFPTAVGFAKFFSNYLDSKKYNLRADAPAVNFDKQKFKKSHDNYCAVKEASKTSCYFADVFSGKESFETFYSLYQVLSSTRHRLMNHAQGSFFSCGRDADFNLISRLLDESLSKINNDFLTLNIKNLNILFAALPSANRAALVQQYYDFVVRKEYENLGFSIKTLRESMLLQSVFSKDYRAENYDSVRSKIYSLWDFYLYQYYTNNENLSYKDKLVDALRSHEKEKEDFYLEEVNRLKSVESFYSTLEMIADEVFLRKGETKVEPIDASALNYSQIEGKGFSDFSHLIFSLTFFLDAKEINMLLTSMINKVENIVSLSEVLNNATLQQQGVIKSQLRKEYRILALENAPRLLSELKVIKSVAKMKKSVKAKKKSVSGLSMVNYLDAVSLFSICDEQTVDDLFGLSSHDPSEKQKTTKKFFINNVLNSKRFNYIVRFINPADAHLIMNNEALVSFALSSIPESQIDRCYEYVRTSDVEVNLSAKIGFLTEQLSDLSLSSLCFSDKTDPSVVEAKRNLVGLYLTVLYLLIKNVVRVNSVYEIAFHALERDYEIMNKLHGGISNEQFALMYNKPAFNWQNGKCRFSYENRYINDKGKTGSKNTADCITRKFAIDGYLNENVKTSIDRNQNLYSPLLFDEYRNIIVHQNAVAALAHFSNRFTSVDNYYDLFHCLVFFTLMEKMETMKEGSSRRDALEAIKEHKCANGKTVFENVLSSNMAYKDLLYALHTPFGYNAARYMNLSRKKLFLQGFSK